MVGGNSGNKEHPLYGNYFCYSCIGNMNMVERDFLQLQVKNGIALSANQLRRLEVLTISERVEHIKL